MVNLQITEVFQVDGRTIYPTYEVEVPAQYIQKKPNGISIDDTFLLNLEDKSKKAGAIDWMYHPIFTGDM